MPVLSEGFVSADSHVVEPADLFVTRMDKRFRDRAPRIEARDDGDYFVIEGELRGAVGMEGAAIEDKIGDGIEGPSGYRHSDTRPGAWDPQARLADQKLDHLAAEIIYPGGFGFSISSMKDPEYQAECARVYNEWLAEFCAAAHGHLVGVGLLPFRCSIDTVLKHAHHAAKLGLGSIAVPMEADKPYYVEEMRGLWDGLQDLGLPVAAGRTEPPSFYFKRQFWATFEEDRAGIRTRDLLNVDHLMWGSDYPHTEGTFPQSQQKIASIFEGVDQTDTAKMVRDNASALYGLKF